MATQSCILFWKNFHGHRVAWWATVHRLQSQTQLKTEDLFRACSLHTRSLGVQSSGDYCSLLRDFGTCPRRAGPLTSDTAAGSFLAFSWPRPVPALRSSMLGSDEDSTQEIFAF